MIAETTPHTRSYQYLRRYFFSVAYRMTGSAAEAEDLVHDAWIRYLDAGQPEVVSLKGWLTTAIARLSLHNLRSAWVREEASVARRAIGRKYPIIHRWLIPWAHRLMGTNTVHFEVLAPEEWQGRTMSLADWDRTAPELVGVASGQQAPGA